MNILILNWRDPKHPLAGGAEISLLEHAKYWQKKGARITWFASSFPGAKEKETIENIEIIRKGSHYTVHVWAYIYFLQGKLGEFDKVIDCFHFLPFFTPLYISKKKTIALIHEVAKEVWFQNMPFVFALVGSTIEPFFFKLYQHIPFITVSKSTKHDLIQVGIREKDITVIENGIHVPKVKKIANLKHPVLLFLGRISQDKGIQDVLTAYKQIYSQLPSAELWIVGKEEKKGFLTNLLKSYEGNIRYFGFVTEQKKYELLQQAWVLLHPSTREGWGLTVIEANSMGTPVVGYDVPGLKDSIVHNKTGLLVKPNSEALAAALMRVLDDKKLYQRLSINAKEWVSRFSWEKSGGKSWSMLKEAYQV